MNCHDLWHSSFCLFLFIESRRCGQCTDHHLGSALVGGHHETVLVHWPEHPVQSNYVIIITNIISYEQLNLLLLDLITTGARSLITYLQLPVFLPYTRYRSTVCRDINN